MGGIGSGRHCHYGAKDTTSDYRSVDVRHWQREGLLAPNQAFGWSWLCNGKTVASIRVRTEQKRIILTYHHRSGSEDWKEESYSVYLDWTTCHYGGERPWFLCPAEGCGRRVAILYCGGIFACRHCYKLAYTSQRETPNERSIRRADKIRKKLGWLPGIINGNGWKPKGMHWHTFERLNKEHDNFVAASLSGTIARFNLLAESLDDWI